MGLWNTHPMRDLSTARQGWDERAALETELIRAMTIPEGVAQFEALYDEFRRTLADTEALEREDRNRSLEDLQHRLKKLADWRRQKALGQPG